MLYFINFKIKISKLLKTTTLGLVLFTTVIFGGIMGKIVKFFNNLQRRSKFK